MRYERILYEVYIFLTFFLISGSKAFAYDVTLSCFNQSEQLALTVEYDIDFPFRTPWAKLWQGKKLIFSSHVNKTSRMFLGGPFQLEMNKNKQAVLTYFGDQFPMNCQ